MSRLPLITEIFLCNYFKRQSMFNITQTNVTIMVSDLNKSIDFYSEVLAFKVLNRYGNFYAQISAPGIIIGLHPSSKKSGNSDVISIGFTIEDFDSANSKLNSLGVQYEERKEEGGTFIHFKDPDETPLYFIKPKK
jgi:catechol 2,3-dioxygenase-like lactoylglutathione lyase family enzyme